jgi:hypothetical protein
VPVIHPRTLKMMEGEIISFEEPLHEVRAALPLA